MEYHIWEILNNDKVKICIDLKEETRNIIYYKIKSDIARVASGLNISPTRLYEYFLYKSSLIPLGVILPIYGMLGLDKYALEKDIFSYRQKSSRVFVKNPILPIKINPVSTFLVSHLYFDGSLPEDGRGTYYNNKSGEIIEDYINAVESIFGDVHYINKLDHRNVLKCRMPRVIGEVLKHIYGVNSFGTKKACLSKFILNLSHEHKIAFLIGAIVDEGSIAYDGSIIFGVTNVILAKQTMQICHDLGLRTGELKQKSKSEHYYFYLKDIFKFNKLVKKISKRYPMISLRHKLNRLDKAIEIKNRGFKYTREFSKGRVERVLLFLYNNPSTINSISSNLLIPPRTVRRYMYALQRNAKVKREKMGTEYVYSLNC